MADGTNAATCSTNSGEEESGRSAAGVSARVAAGGAELQSGEDAGLSDGKERRGDGSCQGMNRSDRNSGGVRIERAVRWG